MKWSQQADQAVKKVPFFVRKKVRKKVEAHVKQKGKDLVNLSDVNELKEKFLSKGGMEKEIKGFDVSSCFGGAGCPNSANACTALTKDIEKILEKEDILSFLKANVTEDLKFHHEFRVALADCPNACSRPQIVDIGIIGSAEPVITREVCTMCEACVEACDEDAITLDLKEQCPVIDVSRCLMCAKCFQVCPSGTLQEKRKGFRVLLGGRLGRHPRLAMEVPGLKTHQEVLEIVKSSIRFYKEKSTGGKRFSHLLDNIDQVL